MNEPPPGEFSALEREVAQALDAPPELLEVLPALLQDLDELGSNLNETLSLIERADLPPGATALELGCGKGVLSVALAERGVRAFGVDAMAPFIDDARVRARRAGVEDRCAFWTGDLRAALLGGASYDLVALISVGPVYASVADTIARLREAVVPRGWILYEDAVLDDPADPPPGYEACLTETDAIASLESRGDRVAACVRTTPEDVRRERELVMPRIRARAAEVSHQRPDLARTIRDYTERQEREYTILEQVVQPILWLIERR